MKILKNINSSWPTHHGALRLLVAAASLTGMALAWAHGDHVTSPYRQEEGAEHQCRALAPATR